MSKRITPIVVSKSNRNLAGAVEVTENELFAELRAMAKRVVTFQVPENLPEAPEIRNLCVVCKTDMGPTNPRQLCRKTFCENEPY